MDYVNSPEVPVNPSSTVLAQAGAVPERPERPYRWARHNYTVLGRLWDIGGFTTQLLWHLWREQRAGQRSVSAPEQSQRYRQRAIWIRERLLHLVLPLSRSGSFSLPARICSPAEYIEELSQLQDRVPAFSYEQVVAIVQRELGQSIDDIYAYFDPIPLASASLGQVHRAQLQSGAEVAVKVQRPGLQRLFAIDLEILRRMTEFVQYRTQWGQGGRDWVGIYEECAGHSGQRWII